MPKPLYKSATIWSAVLTFAAGAGVIVTEYNWPGMWGAEILGAARAALVCALGMTALRLRTSQPVL